MSADEHQEPFRDYWSVTEEDFGQMQVNPPKRRNQGRASAPLSGEEKSSGVAWHTFARRQAGDILSFDTGSHARMAAISLGSHEGRPRTNASPQKPHLPADRRPDKGWPWKLLVLLGGTAFLLLLLFFALTSNAFRVTQVSIENTNDSYLTNKIRQMRIHGQNIFLLNVADLTAQIDALPQVESSDLHKQWPNELAIHVVERVPVLLWQAKTGIYSVDAHGKILATANQTSNASHLNTVIAGQPAGPHLSAPPLKVGDQLDAETITWALDIFKWTSQEAGVSSFKLYYDDTMDTAITHLPEGRSHRKGSYILLSPDGWRAFLGSPWDPNPLNNKLQELQAILAQATQQQFNVGTIDLRYGLHPVIIAKQ